jgi:transcriptional regulator with XRE-family HTH domain
MANPERLRPFQDISDRLRAAREVDGTGQKEFAEGAGLKYTQYKNWESGAHRIGLDGALALRERYGITLEYIYVGEVDSLPMSWRKELSSKPSEIS